ncbi:MAG TPA: hypothetical protein VLZ81_02925, partial [Blastocatellia bacterium]|nr:hypothetical protein [Blastocatellia bacterium]
MTTTKFRVPVVLVMLTAAAATARAQALAPKEPENFLNRSTMTGDWGGLRSELAKKGITFDFTLTQTEMGVVSGGLNNAAEYGGRGDFIMNLDTTKAGLWRGGIFTIEGEVNYGNGANYNSGAL